MEHKQQKTKVSAASTARFDITALRVSFVQAFSVIIIPVLLMLSYYYFLNGVFLSGVFQIIIALLTLSNLLILRLRKHEDISSAYLLVLVLANLLFLLYTNGLASIGTIWYITFPVLAFFLAGKRWGTIWVSVVIVATVLLVFLQSRGLVYTQYTIQFYQNYVATIIILSILIYAYQDIIEHNQYIIKNNTIELAKSISTLSEEIELRTRSEKRLEKANVHIEQEKAKIEAVLLAIGEGLVVVDENLKILLVNQSFEEQLGWTTKEVVGKPIYDILQMFDEHGNQVDEQQRPLNQVFVSHKRFTANSYFYKRKDGSVFPITITTTPILLENSTVGGVAVFRDITREKEVDKAKTEFVSLASHQLKTPLSTINWFTEMVLNGDAGSITPEQKDYLNEVYNACQRMTALVNDLLNVSRIDLGTFAINPELGQLQGIAHDVVSELSRRADTKHIVLSEIYDPVPELPIDLKLTRIVIENLISNAIKYTPDNGNVVVTIHQQSAIESPLKVDSVSLSVADNGYGIPKEAQSKLFSKLFRADNVKDKVVDGNGLGMYIVKSILDQAGCMISFISDENKGTTFTITIPLSGMQKKDGAKQLS
jgi:PAS domain S-box-containing protein